MPVSHFTLLFVVLWMRVCSVAGGNQTLCMGNLSRETGYHCGFPQSPQADIETDLFQDPLLPNPLFVLSGDTVF
jgi:hypothetical protein